MITESFLTRCFVRILAAPAFRRWCESKLRFWFGERL